MFFKVYFQKRIVTVVTVPDIQSMVIFINVTPVQVEIMHEKTGDL